MPSAWSRSEAPREPEAPQEPEAQAAQLRALVQKAPRLALERTEFRIQPPSGDWALEMVSSVAVDDRGVTYLLQRGDRADPVIAVNRQGTYIVELKAECKLTGKSYKISFPVTVIAPAK